MSTPAVKVLLLYDGNCGLCNQTVEWLIRRDTYARLLFAPNTHPTAQETLARHHLQAAPQTLILVLSPSTEAERILTQSEAVLFALKLLPRPWPTLARLAEILPLALRNALYRLIAKYRYRIFGRLDVCPLPSEQDRGRFLP
jgi:predicted DCC family thiol-disulfide oxidoreductase YuxK